MQGVITLLFLIVMFLSWYNQLKKKQQRVEELKKKRHDSIFAKAEARRNSKVKEVEVKGEDLKDRHIKSTIEYRPIETIKRTSSLKRIDRLSYMKKAIIWKEILERP